MEPSGQILHESSYMGFNEHICTEPRGEGQKVNRHKEQKAQPPGCHGNGFQGRSFQEKMKISS